MPTLARRGTGTPVTSGTTWTTVTSAVDGTPPANPATYAVWTSTTSGAVGYIEVTGYDFSAIADGDTLNSVTVSLRHFENNITRIAGVTFQAYLGVTPVGTATTATRDLAARTDSAVVALTLTQLKDSTFKIRATATRAAVTQSATFNVDHIDVTADYTVRPPILLPLSDPLNVTDSITLLKTIGRDLTDVASTLRDGGGNNILGIESSFETDTDLDGLADGWRVPTGDELTAAQAPDTFVRTSLALGNYSHGSDQQRVTKTATGSLPAVIVGPRVQIVPGVPISISFTATNQGASPVSVIRSFIQYNASDVRVTGPAASGPLVDAATSDHITAAGLVLNAATRYIRPAIGIAAASSGEIVLDKVSLREGSQIVLETAWDYHNPAGRLQLTPGAGGLTVDQQDSAGLTDSAAVAVVAGLAKDVTDILGLTDAETSSAALDRSDSAAGGDAVTRQVNLSRVDVTGLVDVHTLAVSLVRNLTDALSVLDTRALTVGFNRPDSIQLRDSVAVAIPGGLGGKPKVWTGSTWAEKPVKVWTGSGWVEKPMKYWSGSAWVPV